MIYTTSFFKLPYYITNLYNFDKFNNKTTLYPEIYTTEYQKKFLFGIDTLYINFRNKYFEKVNNNNKEIRENETEVKEIIKDNKIIDLDYANIIYKLYMHYRQTILFFVPNKLTKFEILRYIHYKFLYDDVFSEYNNYYYRIKPNIDLSIFV